MPGDEKLLRRWEGGGYGCSRPVVAASGAREEARLPVRTQHLVPWNCDRVIKLPALVLVLVLVLVVAEVVDVAMVVGIVIVVVDTD